MFSSEGNIVYNLLRCLLQVLNKEVYALWDLCRMLKMATQQETNCRLLKIATQQETNKFSDQIPPCVDQKSKDI